MALTKYDSYYTKITEQLDNIKAANEYRTQSIAFAHWYLQKHQKLDEQQIAECIIDGSDDLGIDAVIIDESSETLTIFQFKFPSKKENITKEIEQGDILKTWNGFKTLIDNGTPYRGKNTRFAEIKNQIKDIVITHFKIVFVSYNRGVLANKDIVENLVNQFRVDTGSEVETIFHDRDQIANIFERLNRKNNLKINIKYKKMTASYNVEARQINSYVGSVSALELVEAISPYISTIFDENIRLYEYGSKVNEGINRVATSTDQADMFYFYNNGVVFICDKASESINSTTMVLEGASVVNGCQTLNVLYNAKQKGKLRDEVCVPVRIIQISDYSERMKITEYLNSQTQIKASYFVANHPTILELQKKLLEKGYFLERQINEYQFKKEKGQNIGEADVIQLESTIQYFAGYWDNKNASIAKREKNTLFEKTRIEELLGAITADKVIEALNAYRRISEVLTMYRKMRRNIEKTELASYIAVSPEWLKKEIDSFTFMNTGDILILNCVANLRRKYEKLSISEVNIDNLIVESVCMIRGVVKNSNENNISLLTKNTAIFEEVQAKVNELTCRYETTWDL